MNIRVALMSACMIVFTMHSSQQGCHMSGWASQKWVALYTHGGVALVDRYMKEKLLSLEQEDEHGILPLHGVLAREWMPLSEKEELALFLIQSGADLAARWQGYTVEDIAWEYGCVGVIKEILKRKGDNWTQIFMMITKEPINHRNVKL